MDGDLHYFTGHFKSRVTPEKDREEEPTVYAEVKNKQPAAAATAGGEAAAGSHFPPWFLCSAVLSVLLLASIVTIVLIGLQVEKQAAENRRLMLKKSIAENQAENLNWTLGVILEHREFPVSQFCPNKRCQPCRRGWTLFRERCYLFYDQGAPWKTWHGSRKYCADRAAHLVVVDDPEEQEFLSRSVKFYLDEYHGFWIGLNEEGGAWTWTDGRNDTLRFWVRTPLGPAGSCALMLPDRNATQNWDPADCGMLNKFICEDDVLVRTSTT